MLPGAHVECFDGTVWKRAPRLDKGHERAAGMTHTGPTAHRSAQAMSVIVAHRDDDTRVALRTVLENAGYAVLLAGDPETSLAVARTVTGFAVVLFEMEPLAQVGGGFLELALLLASSRVASARASHSAFVALTTAPQHLARPLLRLLRTLDVPLVAEPFDSDKLLRIVARAASRGLGAPAEDDNGAESVATASAPPVTQVQLPRP